MKTGSSYAHFPLCLPPSKLDGLNSLHFRSTWIKDSSVPEIYWLIVLRWNSYRGEYKLQGKVVPFPTSLEVRVLRALKHTWY